MIVYVSIGNSDDKLTQREWSEFVTELVGLTESRKIQRHGLWYSVPGAPYQNMCVCLEIDHEADAGIVAGLRRRLGDLAKAYRQDSIAWAEATTTFLRPAVSEEER